METNDEYINRYEKICDEIGRTIVSVGILRCLGQFSEVDINRRDPRYKIIIHLCELAKRDLVLTVWKLYFDSDSKANTVRSLKRYLYSIGYKKDCKMKLSKEVSLIEKPLRKLRSEYLAHIDSNIDYNTVSIELVVKAFYEIVEMAKCLCDANIDDRAKPISDISIKITEYELQRGLFLMLGELANQNHGGDL